MSTSRSFRRSVIVFTAMCGLFITEGTAAAEPLEDLLGLPPPGAEIVVVGSVAALGQHLFQDASLSADGTISCATCHVARRAFTDGKPRAVGIRNGQGTRNAPSLVNVAYASTLFWDGRRTLLEDQALDPFANKIEHGLASEASLLKAIRGSTFYCDAFQRAFGIACEDVAGRHVASALAAYQRTLRFGNSRFDRYVYAGTEGALSPSEIRGLALFRGRARCVECHLIGSKHALLTDDKFHLLGVGLSELGPRLGEVAQRTQDLSLEVLAADWILTDSAVAALGRYNVTKRPQDIGKFKTPSLRNVAVTAPYMHDGSVQTLDEAVTLEIYYRSRESDRPVIVTPGEKADLIAFLGALTSPAFETGQQTNALQ